MDVHLFRVSAPGDDRALALAAVCPDTEHCAVLWRSASNTVRAREANHGQWQSAMRELNVDSHPQCRAALARLILGGVLDALRLDVVFVGTKHLTRSTTAQDIDEMLRNALTDGAGDGRAAESAVSEGV